MILGMSLPAFTAFHVFISLAALLAGVPLLAGLLQNREYRYVTPAFLGLTTATSVTGFLFPATQVLPSHITGMISLLVLAAAFAARGPFGLKGPWRWIYVACAVTAFYLNMFVTVVQAFLKVPALNALAPTGSEPPFLVAQIVVLFAFVAAGIRAAKRFHPTSLATV